MLKYITFFTMVLLVHLITATPVNYPALQHGKISATDRLKDPKLRDCLVNCELPSTYELNPQCASDGKTYPNTSSFYCMQKCVKPHGEDLTIVSQGYCENDKIRDW